MEAEREPSSYRSGFIVLIGRPNSGKSTLVNTVLGEQLCVVTALPQTTRRRLRGIYTDSRMQLVFVDTPGIHRGDHAFNKTMVRQCHDLLRDKGVDVIAYVVDLYRDLGEEEDTVAAMAADAGIPVLIVFNKIDVCPRPRERIEAFFKRYPALRSCSHISLCAADPSAQEVFIAADSARDQTVSR
jgi:GTP-binding protein Era